MNFVYLHACKGYNKEKMENKEFEFFLPRKDFGKILRYERRYYFLSILFILALLTADGILLGLTSRQGINWFYVIPIPFFSIAYGLIWFFGFTYGGVQIFKHCQLVFHEDGTLTLSCKRETLASYPGEVSFSKTMKPIKLKEKNGYWIVFDNKRQWAVIPKSIPLKEMMNLDCKQ